MIVNVTVMCLALFLAKFVFNAKSGSITNPADNRHYIIIMSIVLILQSGLRNVAVGPDTYQYYRYFKDTTVTPWSQVWSYIISYLRYGTGKDAGYYVFEKAAQIITADYQVYLLLVAVVFFSAFGRFVYKNTDSVYSAMMAFLLYSGLFYTVFSVSDIRQTIAMAGALVAFEYIKSRKLLPFLITMSMSSIIHKSSLVFVPFYFIANVRSTKAIYLLLGLVFPLILVFRLPLMLFLARIGGYQSYGLLNQSPPLVFIVALMSMILLAWWRMEIVLQENDNAHLYYNALALAALLSPLVLVNGATIRIVDYFSICLPVLVPLVLRSFRFKSVGFEQTVNVIAIILLIALTIKAGWGTQYKFFWQHMQLGPNYYR